MSNPTCSTCHWWRAIPEQEAIGKCQLNPPQAFLIPVPRVLEPGKYDNMLACASPQTEASGEYGCHSDFDDEWYSEPTTEA
jgi:hypothetical protein